MKNSVFILVLFLGFYINLTTSCDKIDHPYQPSVDIDTTLIEGTWQNYLDNYWPDFPTMVASTDRNVLIEDYTGHRCPNCPSAATIAHDLHSSNPERVFIASIHSSSVGISSFQLEDDAAGYPSILYNDLALEIGAFFGNYAEAGFFANPQGTVNRAIENNFIFSQSGEWETRTSNILNSTLKVKMKAKVNYFESTRGLYLHTEIENINSEILNPLGIVTYLIEDSLVAPQTMPDNTKNPSYVHREIHRGSLDNFAFGQTLGSDKLKDGKYYYNYSYKLPEQYEPSNMHVLVYVYDKTTFEIYQVLKLEIE